MRVLKVELVSSCLAGKKSSIITKSLSLTCHIVITILACFIWYYASKVKLVVLIFVEEYYQQSDVHMHAYPLSIGKMQTSAAPQN
jgi:hypothetical protein